MQSYTKSKPGAFHSPKAQLVNALIQNKLGLPQSTKNQVIKQKADPPKQFQFQTIKKPQFNTHNGMASPTLIPPKISNKSDRKVMSNLRSSIQQQKPVQSNQIQQSQVKIQKVQENQNHIKINQDTRGTFIEENKINEQNQKEKQISQRNKSNKQRGRNQPSQLSHSPSLPKSNISAQKMPNENEVHLVKVCEEQIRGYGNDEDIYELEKMNQVLLIESNSPDQKLYIPLPPCQILEKTPSISLDLSSNKPQQFIQKRFSDPRVGMSSIRQMIKQKSMKDLRIQLSSHESLTNLNQNPFLLKQAFEIHDISGFKISQVNKKQIRGGFIIFGGNQMNRSKSFSPNSSINKDQENNNDDNNSEKFKEQSLVSGSRIQIKDGSNHCDSLSEKTMLDVLGLNNMSKHFVIQQVDQNFHNSRSSPILLVQTNNQIIEQSSNQILFNNQNESENSFSTNRFVHNFAEEKEKQKDLEALKEVDNESDVTEQMTFCQNSRSNSKISLQRNNKDQQNQDKIKPATQNIQSKFGEQQNHLKSSKRMANIDNKRASLNFKILYSIKELILQANNDQNLASKYTNLQTQQTKNSIFYNNHLLK